MIKYNARPATMLKRRINKIVSNDKDLDNIPGIQRIILVLARA
jgi:predicted nucleic acid-binding protein